MNQFAETVRKRLDGMEHAVESCCDGGKQCNVETEGVDLHPPAAPCSYEDTHPYALSGALAGFVLQEHKVTDEDDPIYRSEQATIQERMEPYGKPDINQSAIGLHWTAQLRQAFQREDIPVIPGWLAAQMMCAVKLSRLARTPKHEDSEHDLRTYLLLSRTLSG
jgi:hypothetical protein